MTQANITFERITEGTDFNYGRIIRSIIEDSCGFIWIGTDQELLRYDGYNFKVYRHNKYDPLSIPSRGISCLFENRVGNLLVSASFHILFEFDIQYEKFSVIDTAFLNEKSEPRFTVDNSGLIWIGTLDEGLFKFDKSKNTWTQYTGNDQGIGSSINCNFVNSLFFDKESEILYIGTKTGGVNAYNHKTQRFSHLLNEDYSSNPEKDTRVRHIFKDSRKNLWFCTQEGLIMYNEQSNTISRFVHDQFSENSISDKLVYTICEDKDGLLWIGTDKGLNSFDFEKKEFTRYLHDKENTNGIFSNMITNLLCDKSNTMFFGTKGGGIGKFNLNKTKFHILNIKSSNPDNTNSNHISSIYKDKQNNLWVGTYRGSFFKCTPVTNNSCQILEFKELDGVQITGISGINNDVWITCNKKSLCFINIFTNELQFVDQNIFSEFMQVPYEYIFCQCIDKLNPDYLWLSVNWKYLILFDTVNKQIIKNEFATKNFFDLHIIYLFVDSRNNLWVGTRAYGVFRYDIINNEVTNYNYEEGNDNSLSDSGVNSIAEDFNNNLWIGTIEGGVNKLVWDQDKFEKFTINEGLPSNRISGMIMDDHGNLWIGSNEAMTKFNISTRECVNFTESGSVRLTFNTFACHKSHDGIIYFGTVFGVVYFNPDEITTNPHIPNIVLTDFQILYESVKPSFDSPFLKKSISYAKEINLTHKESVITFEFAALIYNNPMRNQYAYKMEGFDDDWVYCGTRRTATYTNLDPGEYTFRVKGSNNDGLWNEEGTSIKIIITPPWYKTVLFKGLVGLSVIGSIGSFYRKRIQKLNKEKSQQEEFTKKLIESQENERKRVAAELHDSLGQDLLIIKNKALVSIKKTKDFDKLKEEMSEISDLTSATLNDVREISYNLRPYELDRLGLSKTIESMIERANNSTDIKFTGDIDNIDKIFMPEAEINIYRVIQESLNNVIKHSEAKEVIVSVLKKEKEIIINISDDGKGFDIRKYKMNSKRKGFGLKGIEERVRLLNGVFGIESEVGKSTTIRIIIPLSK